VTPEKIVQNGIIKYMDQMIKQGEKIRYFRREAIGQAYQSGIPDLYAIVRGLHVEIECKREAGGKVSQLQIKKRAELESVGSRYICPNSVEEFKEFIEEVIRDGKEYERVIRKK